MVETTTGTLPNDYHKPDTLYFNMLDRQEIGLLLGIMKNVECSMCPDFFKGCSGSYSRQDLAIISSQDYMNKQKKGTEKFLCGKLRSMYLLEKARLNEIEEAYNNEFNKNIGFLSEHGRIVVSSVDHENQMAEVEAKFKDQLDGVISHANKKLADMQILVESLQRKLNILAASEIKPPQI